MLLDDLSVVAIAWYISAWIEHAHYHLVCHRAGAGYHCSCDCDPAPPCSKGLADLYWAWQSWSLASNLQHCCNCFWNRLRNTRSDPDRSWTEPNPWQSGEWRCWWSKLAL